MKLFKQIGVGGRGRERPLLFSSQSVSQPSYATERGSRAEPVAASRGATYAFIQPLLHQRAKFGLSSARDDDDGAKEIDFQVMGPLVMQPALLDFRTMGDGRTRLFATGIIRDAHFRHKPNKFRLTAMSEGKRLKL